MSYEAALIALSALAIILLVPAFIWHSKTVNIPLITLLVWLLIMNVKTFVDAIIWGGKDYMERYDGAGYCDVMVKLQVGANVGISSSVAGVMFNLYRILKADSALPGLRSFKKIATDLALSLLTPVVVMALNYIVQSRRYTIFQYSGCQNITQLSWVTIVIYTMWLVIWSFVGVVFAVMIIFTYFQKRKDVRDILRCTNSGLNLARFAKLLLFCCVVVLVMFPVSMYIFTQDIGQVNDGSFDFEFVHSPAVWNLISYASLGQPYYTTWVYLGLSYAVFIFFGLGSDAIDMYLQGLRTVGLGSIVNWLDSRRNSTRILKADKLVSSVLDRANIITPTGSTPFDLEMQRIIEDEDNKSPASTQVSNVFGDKNALTKAEYDPNFNYMGDMGELDEEDLKYINMLYSEDADAKTVRDAEQGETGMSSPDDIATQTLDVNANRRSVTYGLSAGEFGYSRRITHYAP